MFTWYTGVTKASCVRSTTNQRRLITHMLFPGVTGKLLRLYLWRLERVGAVEGEAQLEDVSFVRRASRPLDEGLPVEEVVGGDGSRTDTRRHLAVATRCTPQKPAGQKQNKRLFSAGWRFPTLTEQSHLLVEPLHRHGPLSAARMHTEDEG